MALGTALCHRHANGTRMALALQRGWSDRLATSRAYEFARSRPVHTCRASAASEAHERGRGTGPPIASEGDQEILTASRAPRLSLATSVVRVGP